MKILFALALVVPTVFLGTESCNAVKVNGQEVNNDFSYESNSSSIAFKVQDGAIQVGEADPDRSHLNELEGNYANLNGQLQTKKEISLYVQGGIKDQYTSARCIVCAAESEYSIKNCILEARLTSFTGNKISLSCYVNSNSVVLKPYDSSNSTVKELKFLRKTPSATNRFFMEGNIDFADNMSTSNELIVYGAEEVIVKLR